MIEMMMRRPIVTTLLRSTAAAIAIAAVIDPTVTSNRTTKPVVALVAADGRTDSVLADRVERTLAKSFATIRARMPSADATVIVGDSPPATGAFDFVSSPAFAVFSDRDGPTVTLDAVRAPARTPADARAPIAIDAHVTGARGRTVDLTLRRGDLVVDRATRSIPSDDERVTPSLSFIPTAVGAAPLRVSATVDGTRSVATADLVVDVLDKRWAVLFFDPRPSWTSTFARRALERDPRFVITSRVVTSRNVSTDAGNPPGRLDDLAALELFDAVVVGAPEALSANDVDGLDAFLRRRGGSVVLLFDRRANGPYQRLTQVVDWSADSSGKAISLAPITGDSGTTGTLRASEFAWPTRLPDGAEPLVRAIASSRDTAAGRPVVWRSAVGAGRLVVSGALDAWRFRDRSAFDRYWQTLIADAANAAPPPIDVNIASSAISPGGETAVAVTLRDEALATIRPVHASVSATLESVEPGRPSTNVRLWPDANLGQFRGTVRGGTPGVYRLVVSSGGSRTEIPIVVANDLSYPVPEAHDLLAAWAIAHGGRALPASRIKELPGALRDAIRPTPHLETWHPMRSAWWIVPFALALSGEWWLRRRRGLA